MKDRNALQKYISKTVNPDGRPDEIFKCDICGKTSTRKDNLLNHVENIHFPGTFDYKCHICTLPMATRTALNNHIQRNHKDGEIMVVKPDFVGN